jgi:hypothetical protein
MKMLVLPIFLITLFSDILFAQDYGPHQFTYSIDNSIRKVINKLGLEGKGSMDAANTRDGEPVTGLITTKGFPFHAFSYLKSDTAYVTFMTMMGAIGVSLRIYKDSASGMHFVSYKDRSIKIFKSDSSQADFQHSPAAPAKKFKLILTEIPQAGKPVEGYLEFESVVFYSQRNGGLAACTYSLKGYFRSDILK